MRGLIELLIGVIEPSFVNRIRPMYAYESMGVVLKRGYLNMTQIGPYSTMFRVSP